jgi:pyrroloquinoline quinone biosynthesis protein D
VRATNDSAAGGRICLAPGIRLDGSGEGETTLVLVCPEGNVPLNRIAAAILRLCDGSRDRVQIVAEILRDTSNQARSSDIDEFLDAAAARRWIDES